MWGCCLRCRNSSWPGVWRCCIRAVPIVSSMCLPPRLWRPIPLPNPVQEPVMNKSLVLFLMLLPGMTLAADNVGAVAPQYRFLTFLVFGAIIALTMFVTYRAAKRVHSASDFYTAGGGISGLQNGWGSAGGYLSAASFLGIAGLISLYGYDG